MCLIQNTIQKQYKIRVIKYMNTRSEISGKKDAESQVTLL